jgi:hypothetical protein
MSHKLSIRGVELLICPHIHTHTHIRPVSCLTSLSLSLVYEQTFFQRVPSGIAFH